ncbi:MAG: hypothetical protein ACPGWR_16375 [Ardenticatenaceae bacterium]
MCITAYKTTISWLTVAGLLGVIAMQIVLSSQTASPSQAGIDALLAQFASAMQAGDVAGVINLYHSDGQHRDLSNGQFASGRGEIDIFLRSQYALQDGVSAVDLFTVKMRAPTVAIVNLDVKMEEIADDSPTWPPFVVLVLTYSDEQWGIAASRAGGNPDTKQTGITIDE